MPGNSQHLVNLLHFDWLMAALALLLLYWLSRGNGNAKKNESRKLPLQMTFYMGLILIALLILTD